MRKSSLILLLAMAFVLTTVATGFSADELISEPCIKANCDKNNTGTWVYGQQIDYTLCNPDLAQGPACPCPIFDYELGSAAGNYCTKHDVKGIIFKLCDCDKIDEFNTASSYAVRLTIMEPAGGVYWTNSNVARADMTCSSAVALSDCPAGVTAAPDDIRISRFQDPALTGGDYCLDPCSASSLAAGVVTEAVNYYSMTAGQDLFDTTTNTVDCCFTCGNNRVTTVQTCYYPMMHNLQSILLIDIPTMVYDPNEADVKLGVAVKVKVEIVEMPDTGDICAGACKVLCDCLVDVGTFSECFAGGCNLCLPYLADDGTWWTGIALTNPNKTLTDKVEITLYADGESASTTVSVAPMTVKAVSVADLLADMDLPEAPMYGSIASEGAIEAFVMIGTGMDAVQGYVAPDGPCGCGAVYHGNK